MKYIFRGHIVFEFDIETKRITQHTIKADFPVYEDLKIPAFDFCNFIPEDYKLLSEFFDKCYRYTEGETNLNLKDIEVY